MDVKLDPTLTSNSENGSKNFENSGMGKNSEFENKSNASVAGTSDQGCPEPVDRRLKWDLHKKTSGHVRTPYENSKKQKFKKLVSLFIFSYFIYFLVFWPSIIIIQESAPRVHSCFS